MSQWTIIEIPPNPIAATEYERTHTTFLILQAPPAEDVVNDAITGCGNIYTIPDQGPLTDPNADYEFYIDNELQDVIDDTVYVDGEATGESEITLDIIDPTGSYFIEVSFTWSPSRIDGVVGRQYIHVESDELATLDSNGNVIRTEDWFGGATKRGLDGLVYFIGDSHVYRKRLNGEAESVSIVSNGTMIDSDKSGRMFIKTDAQEIKMYTALGSFSRVADLGLNGGRIISMQADMAGNVRGLAVFERSTQDDSSCLYKISATGVVEIYNILPLYLGLSTPGAWGFLCYIDPVLANYYVVARLKDENAYGFNYLRKYSSAGSMIWETPIYSEGEHTLTSIVVDRSGNSYISISSGNILKVNDNGSPVWSNLLFEDDSFEGYPGNSFNEFSSDIDFSGNFYGVPIW